jgi:hypothetical protein
MAGNNWFPHNTPIPPKAVPKAPPVYRPGSSAVRQPQRAMHGGPPPVYRPNPQLQSKPASVQPVVRPAPRPQAILRTIVQPRMGFGNRGVIQRAGISGTAVGALGTDGSRLEIRITGTLAAGGAEVFTVNLSEGKHLLASYSEQNVTTANSGLNTNTIARVDRATFRRAFTNWATECAAQLLAHGTDWDPHTHVFMTPEGISFGSDSNGTTHTIHSFPVGGTVTVLTDSQYDLLKEVARAYYALGNTSSAAAYVNSVLRNVGRNGDVTAVVNLLGITRATLVERVGAVIETAAWSREQTIWQRSFFPNLDTDLFS